MIFDTFYIQLFFQLTKRNSKSYFYLLHLLLNYFKSARKSDITMSYYIVSCHFFKSELCLLQVTIGNSQERSILEYALIVEFPSFRVFGVSLFYGNCTQIIQIIGTDTKIVLESLQLYILYPMSFHASLATNCSLRNWVNFLVAKKIAVDNSIFDGNYSVKFFDNVQ